MRILIVEDEKKVADFLSEGLKTFHYKVDVASNGQAGAEMALINHYNVILLDYMLPKMNGLDLLKSLKAQQCLSKIIMITAKDEVEEKINCLNHGADDYMVKPFSFQELLARIRAVLRRNEQEKNSCLIYEGLQLNLLTMEAHRDDQKLELTALELSLLEYFLRHQQKLVTRAQLWEQVWADDHSAGDSNKIEVYIFYLRQKIDKGFDTKLLHTVRGKGYILK